MPGANSRVMDATAAPNPATLAHTRRRAVERTIAAASSTTSVTSMNMNHHATSLSTLDSPAAAMPIATRIRALSTQCA